MPGGRRRCEFWKDVRQFWLEECGEKLGLEHREAESKAIACSRRRWNQEVLAEIASHEAREILKWQDDSDDGGGEFELLGDGEEKEDEDGEHKDKKDGPGGGGGRTPKPKDTKSPFSIAERAQNLAKKKKSSEPVDESEVEQGEAEQE